MSDAARNLAPRLREHANAMDAQIDLMQSGSIRILHLNMDVTPSALDRARAASQDLRAILEVLGDA